MREEGGGSLLGNQCCLAEHSEEDSEVEHCTPEPVSRVVPSRLLEIAPEENDREAERDLRRNDQ